MYSISSCSHHRAILSALIIVIALKGSRSFIRHHQSSRFDVTTLNRKLSIPSWNNRILHDRSSRLSLSSSSSLLPDPVPNSIGNFFENKTDSMSFIQCYMLSVGVIKNTQYGIGFPVDMPVMLTYFEGNELKPVQPDYPDYEHLINHVSVQLDSNDLQLYNTPVVLTLQGEFEDESLNQIYPGTKLMDEGDEDMLDFDEEGGREEITIADVIRLEGMGEEDDSLFDYNDDDDDADEEVEDDEAFGNDHTLNELEEDNEEENSDDLDTMLPDAFASIPDFTLIKNPNGDVSDIPLDAFVTEEDTKGLKRAHKRADRIIQYADDVSLIASFHYKKKKNFHLVKLLEPIFIIGRRIEDIKGYYFTLLSPEESAEVTPVLEDMMVKRANENKYKPPASTSRSSSTKRGGDASQSSAASRRSRRRWSSR